MMSVPDENNHKNTSYQVDEFWEIALEYPVQSAQQAIDDDSDDETTIHCNRASKPYYIPLLTDDPSSKEELQFVLNLAPMKKLDGAWTALGADAWFASGILSSLLLQSLSPSKDNVEDDQCRGIPWDRWLSLDTTITVLEIGSGAVGLSGLVLALVLGLATQRRQRQRNDSVLLTDCENDVLQQLRTNVHANEQQLVSLLKPLANVKILAEALDWNDAINSPLKSCSDLKLVVGSELVYTDQTALACAKIILCLLRQHPDLIVLIVQVSDRPGFEDVFLPLLHQEPNVQVQLDPIAFGTYDMATRIVSQSIGGTLDRHAFVSCWISNRSPCNDGDE